MSLTDSGSGTSAVRPPRIVVVGSFNTDLATYTKRLPRPGESVTGHRFAPGPGGKGTNQAVVASRLGAEVTFVGRIGDDVFSPLALGLFAEEDVNTDFLVQDPDHSTGVAPILIDENGENSIVVVLGANLAVSRDDVDAARARIEAADLLMVQLEIPLDVVEYALEVGKASGVRTILNPAPAAKVSDRTIELADLVTPNETELDVLSGGGDEEVVLARRLLRREDQAVIITQGARGATIVTRGEATAVPGFAVEAVDTTGAGDAFNGSLGYALGRGSSIEEAVRFANAAAAVSVTKPGTAPAMPYLPDVEKMLAS